MTNPAVKPNPSEIAPNRQRPKHVANFLVGPGRAEAGRELACARQLTHHRIRVGPDDANPQSTQNDQRDEKRTLRKGQSQHADRRGDEPL